MHNKRKKMNKNLPNFFIVGAAKAGTTSLYNYLVEHSDVYMSPIKEPNYFSKDIRFEDFRIDYKKTSYIDFNKYFSSLPLKFLHIAYIEKQKDYEKLFEGSENYKVRGEISNSYLFSKKAAEEIRNNIPDAKILIVLRNPIERAYSHYLMDARGGYTGDSFRTAVEKDWNKKRKGWGISSVYLELGMYATQVERFLIQFPKEQIQIMLFDDLKKDPLSFVKKVYSFLDIDLSQIDQKIFSGTHNKSTMPKFKKIFHFLKNFPGMSVVIKLLPKKIKTKLESIFLMNKTPKLSREDREYFYPYFEKEITDLECLTGLDLSSWKVK